LQQVDQHLKKMWMGQASAGGWPEVPGGLAESGPTNTWVYAPTPDLT